ncbi:MAG: helix-turn-helix transcriptional regulator [Deltaproteobacteria bacterium]|nr:helix-turn-helix transcriptional regulator [Deltaproteobacteria bacterium]
MTHTDHRRLLLLGVLHHAGMHGYQLHAHIAENGLIGLRRPAAYALLDGMVGRGWLSTREETVDGRTRQIHQLTPAGEEALLHLVRTQLGQDEPPDLPNLVSLGLLDLLPADEAAQLLRQRREELLSALERLSPDDTDDPHHGGLLGLVLGHVAEVRRAELALLDQLILHLEHTP